ncbi:hypothetical protein [Spongiimicrobium sp. 2-473A-2-J]|uniref:hypothetical protein n=1 Tax=Eudoraea algarum TaxID=3417568 RepID=UPI003D36D038
MRSIKSLFGMLIVASLLSGCSSVKVTDSWRGLKTLDIKEKNILVVSKTKNKTTRMRFEKDLVQNLNKNGFQAVEAHVKFPLSDPLKEVKNEEIDQVIENLWDQCIDIVIVSHLVDSKEYTTTVSNGDSYYSDPFSYRYRRYRSFYGYQGFYSNHNTVEIKGTKYIVETLVYDLAKPKNEQLLTIITLEVDNPSTLGSVSKDFSNSIVKRLVK